MAKHWEHGEEGNKTETREGDRGKTYKDSHYLGTYIPKAMCSIRSTLELGVTCVSYVYPMDTMCIPSLRCMSQADPPKEPRVWHIHCLTWLIVC